MPFYFTLRSRSWIEVKAGELPQLLCCISIKTNLEITVFPSVRNALVSDHIPVYTKCFVVFCIHEILRCVWIG
jgi:hypothetical protein